jgi:hypothetical protein
MREKSMTATSSSERLVKTIRRDAQAPFGGGEDPGRAGRPAGRSPALPSCATEGIAEQALELRLLKA